VPASPKYGFLGGGVMAEAILRALLAAGVATPEQVVVSEPQAGRREAIAALGAGATAENAAAAAAETVILAVKPGVVPEVAREIGPLMGADQLLVTIAAGVPMARIEALVEKPLPMVRAMPNVLITVGEGATAICGGPHAGAAHVEQARELFAAGGRVVEVTEPLLDAVTGLSGSGPGYVMLLIEALADGGVHAGLPRQVALTLAAQTVLGTAKLLLEQDDHPAVWKDRVATPGGTTMAGLAALEEAGVRGAMIRAVGAATQRARELSEKT
jgi:pyrroline-5-carboxylate reductase